MCECELEWIYLTFYKAGRDVVMCRDLAHKIGQRKHQFCILIPVKTDVPRNFGSALSKLIPYYYTN